MGGNSIDRLERYHLTRLRAARQAGVISVVVVIIYTVLAEFSLVPRSYYYESAFAFSIVFLLSAIILWQLTGKKMTIISRGLFICLLHLISGFLIIFVTGFLSPITIFWLLLITISDLFFSKHAASMSIILLYFVMLMPLFFGPGFTDQTFLLNLGYATAIAIIGWFIREIRTVQSDEHNDLVSTRKREVSQQNQLMTLVNSMSQSVISITPDGHIQLYNAATLDLLDTNHNLSGQSIDKVFQLVDENNQPVNILMELEKAGHAMQRNDLSYKAEDGDLIHLDISSSTIYGTDNQVTGRIIIIRDITKSKSLDEERDEFISIVSHELRTPITITEGTVSNLQLLLDRGASASMLKKSISSAHDQIIYLSRMINDLSTLSRAERNIGDEKELIDLRKLGEDLFNDYLKKAEKRQLALDIELPKQRIYVYSSRLYLEEILQNLLTNALKYTPKGSVTLAIKQLDASHVRLSVADTGIGISKADQKKLFDKFYRSEDYRTRETSGTGLGLYVVSKLATKLKTKVELDSMISKGSTFSFILPLASKQQIDKYRSVK